MVVERLCISKQFQRLIRSLGRAMALTLSTPKGSLEGKIWCGTQFLCVVLAFVLTCPPAPAETTERLETTFFGQAIVRPESRQDRPTGTFHESRIRLVAPIRKSSSEASPSSLSTGPQLGAYLLNEWVRDAAAAHVLSPFIGWIIRDRQNWSEAGWPLITQVQLSFEGRSRQPMGETPSAGPTQGWDPRTNLTAGAWWQLAATEEQLWALDSYAELGLAPRFSGSGYGAGFVRLLNRRSIGLSTPTAENSSSDLLKGRWYVDVSMDCMVQETATLELGTRRQEVRAGLAFAWVSLKQPDSNGLSLRLTHGWPILKEDARSRWEALLSVGAAL